MDFTRRHRIVKVEDNLGEEYPHVLSLYKDPPTGEIGIIEFEELAFERVQMLRILEQATQMGKKMYSAEWRTAVLGYLREHGLRRYIRLLESTGCSSADADIQIRREDYLSHFILRLAYCRSLDLRNWFIAREMELFKMRFLHLSPEGLKKFMATNKLYYVPITREEKDAVKDRLFKSTTGHSHVQIDSSDFYKVPFTEVLDLVKNHSVYIFKGFAYIPTNELISCVMTWYRVHLTERLIHACKKLPCIEDERIVGLLTTLHASYNGKDYSTADYEKSGITAENLHYFVRKSFPLCMRSIYDVIKTTHHMKHFGRVQFGLFLKGIGLSLEQSINYWQTEFCKKIDEESFRKTYLYNIKYSYGTLGKMVNYVPYGCKKVISSEPGPGEHHGCPFKQWDADLLKQRILEFGVPAEAAREVVDIASKGHYQIACTKYFQYTHGAESKQVINHPNQYFEESTEIAIPMEVHIETPGIQEMKRNFSNIPKNVQSTANDPANEQIVANTVSQDIPLDESVFDDEFDVTDMELDY